MTTFSPGTGGRIAVFDMGNCYGAGTVIAATFQGYVSASWPGNTKRFDSYIITGYSLADLAAKEAAVDAGGTGFILHQIFDGHVDSTAGAYLETFGTSLTADPFPTTGRYLSLYVKPQFNTVPWYTNDTSTISGTTGASSTSCPVDTPIADFTASDFTPALAQVITFTDLSTNGPTSWAWTFGDGGTSTSQNPTHAYSVVGNFDVTLTATNSNGSDSETKSAYISVLAVGTPEPEAPAGVLLEIYAASPGSARWDVAKWDEAVWSGAGWQDVTPYGVHVNILWGASRGDQGILTVPDAASWAVDYYDPDRILDPANESGPYFGDLKPYLPIRTSHRGTVVRQGIVTGISHSFAKGNRVGYMRGADNITILANAQVPSDTPLSDTLYARAVDAIAAAGLSVTVAAPIGVDPPVSPWLTGTREWSVWEWIKDAAQEVLHIPIIDRLGTVTFRAWASPLARARTINSPELIDMQDVVDYSGQYSVVQARQDEDVMIERRLTPSPAYGARTFTRDEITIDPDLWAEAVLADRALPGLLWLPGDVYPLTANAVEKYALLEAVELVSMSLPEQDPPVFASGIVVGGEIDILGRAQDQQGVWRFTYQTAQTKTEPLIETGGDPTDYLLRTGGGEYLYPTGSA